ncbi:hypothetical protein DRN74_02165 [Candidatus Micrarchaeota archaeon]|nr:MAG: hypothetical protein DRN74_02165 [Candidatus Micrarchaeota archaeon]
MKVNFVIPGYPARVGHTISAISLKEALENEGIEVRISSKIKEGFINHAHVNDLISRSTFNSILGPINRFSKPNFDVITAYGPAAPNLRDIMMHIKYYNSMRALLQLFYLFSVQHLPNILKPDFRKIPIIASSHYLKDKMIQGSNVLEVSVIPPPMKAQVSKVKLSSEKLILFIGKGYGVRGDMDLIKAASQVIQEDNDISFIIANKSLGERKNVYLRLIKKLGIESYIHLYGKLDQSAIDNLIAKAAIVAFPYACAYGPTSMPLSLLEAMARGKAVISTDIGAIGEIIQHEKNGLIVPPGDEKALADAILKAFKNKQILRLGKAALETVTKKFNPKSIAKAYIEIYNSI